MKARQVAVPAVCILVGLLAGYQLGHHHSAAVTWHTGLAYIGDHEVSISTPGWIYGAQDAVPGWIDSGGSTHNGGWPDCLNSSGTQNRSRSPPPTSRLPAPARARSCSSTAARVESE